MPKILIIFEKNKDVYNALLSLSRDERYEGKITYLSPLNESIVREHVPGSFVCIYSDDGRKSLGLIKEILKGALTSKRIDSISRGCVKELSKVSEIFFSFLKKGWHIELCFAE